MGARLRLWISVGLGVALFALGLVAFGLAGMPVALGLAGLGAILAYWQLRPRPPVLHVRIVNAHEPSSKKASSPRFVMGKLPRRRR